SSYAELRDPTRSRDVLPHVGHRLVVGYHLRAGHDLCDADHEVAADRDPCRRGVGGTLLASPASSMASPLAASSSRMRVWKSSAPAYFTPRPESVMKSL